MKFSGGFLFIKQSDLRFIYKGQLRRGYNDEFSFELDFWGQLDLFNALAQIGRSVGT